MRKRVEEGHKGVGSRREEGRRIEKGRWKKEEGGERRREKRGGRWRKEEGIYHWVVGLIYKYMYIVDRSVLRGMVSQSSIKHNSQRRGRPAPN